MSIAVNAFLRLALAEIRVARAGDAVSPDDQDDALAIFNELLDSLNADGRALYTSSMTQFTLTPSLQPHTIGLAANTPTFAVSVGRPADIKAANLVLTNVTPNIRIPLNLRDDAWWMDQRARGVTASIPCDLFYSADWPNGAIYLWPVPLTAYGLELNFSTLLAQVAATDTFDLPAGYQQALRLTLAELLAPAFGQTVSQSTRDKARDARARVWGNNDVIPNLCTRDAGMPGGSGGGFSFLTGRIG